MESSPVGLVRRVYISHTTEATNYVLNELQPALLRAGLEVLQAEPDAVGANWTQALEDAAAHSAVLVAVVSDSYVTSYRCMRELDLALSLERPNDSTRTLPLVIPVLYTTQLPSEGDERWQELLSTWRQQGQQHGTDTSRWARNVQHLSAAAAAWGSQLSNVADTREGTRQVVQQAVAAMHSRQSIVYDWQQLADLVAKAAVPEPDKKGVALMSDGRTGALILRDLFALLSQQPANQLSRAPSATAQQAPISRLLVVLDHSKPHGYVPLAAGPPGVLPEPGPLSKFTHTALIDLQCADGTLTIPRSALRSILQQLGDTAVSVLYDSGRLLERLKSFVCDKAVLLVLLNVTTQEQYDRLVPDSMGPGSFVFVHLCLAAARGQQHSAPRARPYYALGAARAARAAARAARAADAVRAAARAARASGFKRVEHCPGDAVLLDPEQAGLLQVSLVEAGLRQRLLEALNQCQEEQASSPGPQGPSPFSQPWSLSGTASGLEGATLAGLLDSVPVAEQLNSVPLEGLLDSVLQQLSPVAQSMFFDAATVLEGQPYREAVAVWNAQHDGSAGLGECFSVGDALAQLGHYGLVGEDHSGRLTVPDGYRELVRSFLCSPLAARQYGFEVGNWVWMEQDAPPGALANALMGGVGVRAAKVDAATALQLACMGNLSGTCILIVSPSKATLSDGSLPAPKKWRLPPQADGTPLLSDLRWLDLGCGVADLAPWLQDAPNLVVLRATEARSPVFGSITGFKISSRLPRPKYSLEELPCNIQGLSALQFLDLHDCSNLRSLPDTITELPALQELHLRSCSSLKVLPTDIGLMPSLTVLELSNCVSLSALPGGLGRLHTLQKLDLTGCIGLKRLPPSVWSLTNLCDYQPPREAGEELPDLPPQFFKLKPRLLDKKDRFTLLSIDGGGMRGLIPARVLETVEKVLKKEAWEASRPDSPAKAAFVERFGDLPEWVTGPHMISVDLADFFDAISGTSTGSILASYLATKGAYTADNILYSDEYSADMAKIRKALTRTGQQQAGADTDAASRDVQTPGTAIHPGSAQAAQAMFVATGPTIFPKKSLMKRRFLAGPGKYFYYKHSSDGIERVLQQSFGREGAGALRLSCGASRHAETDARRPALHTSLLVPTFHLESNHAVLFWHGRMQDSSSSDGGASSSKQPLPRVEHAWGFTTINRMRPPKWLMDRLEGRSCRGGVRHGVNVKFASLGAPVDSHAPTQARLMFESSGDTMHVYAMPPHDSFAAAASLSSSGAPALSSQLGSLPLDKLSLFSLGSAGLEARDAAGSGHSMDQGTGKAAATTAAISNEGPAQVLDFKLWEVVRASTAAPTYFPAHTMSVRAPLKPPQRKEHWSMLSSGKGERGRFVDGGVVANNPTIAGISFLQRIYPGSNMTNTAVLSLGCGSCWSSSGLPTAGGQLGAAGPMVEIMMGANCDTAAAAGEMLYRTARLNLQGNSSSSSSSSGDSFLRVQAVAFESDDYGFGPDCVCQQPPPPNATQHHVQSSAPGQQQKQKQRRKRWSNYHMIGPDKKDQVAAIQRMDEPEDWQALLQIGADLAQHFEGDIRQWVRTYLLRVADSAAAAAAGLLPEASLSDGSQQDGVAAAASSGGDYVLMDGPVQQARPVRIPQATAFVAAYQQQVVAQQHAAVQQQATAGEDAVSGGR